MVEQPPTPEQSSAIEAPGSVAVRAGAGSGKTTVLARRYVHLLRPDGAEREAHRLLAITFTEKAAAEMRARIRALVAARAAHAATERPHWMRVQRDLLGSQISTIHAFCARLVREHPIEAGVDPDARVLDADETRRYLDARVETHLLELLGRGHVGARDLLRRCRGLRGRRGGGAVGTMIRLLGALGRLGRRGAWAHETTIAWSERRDGAPELARVAAGLSAAVETRLGRTTSRRVAPLADAWPRWRARLEALAAVGDEAATLLEPGGWLTSLAEALAAAGAGRDTGSWLRLEGGRLRGEVPAAVASLGANDESVAIAELVRDVDARLAADKRRDAVLTFDDLVMLARDVVVTRPSVRAQVARRFDAVLLDECQDTDPVQAELLQTICREGPDLYVVGDEKQAIYGFRGADVGVFERLLRELPERRTLGLNFRSVPGILAFVNVMGARLLQRPPGAVVPDVWTTFAPEHELRPDRAPGGPGPAVRLVTLAEELRRRGATLMAARREVEAQVLAEVVHDLVTDAGDAVEPGDVTVLFRSLREVKTYEHALARRAIPYHVVKGRGFFQCQEVRDVVNLLAVVADRADQLALAAVLRSPWVALGDDELWALVRAHGSLARGVAAAGDPASAVGRLRTLLDELRALRSRGSIAEVLVRALEGLDLDAVLLARPQGDQYTANVRKVLDLARTFERAGRGGVPEFVDWMRRRDAQDADEPEAHLASEEGNVVRLMTIHQAKGLEFPVVVLVDLGRRLPHDGEALVVDEEAGVVATPLVGAGGHPVASRELLAHRARLSEREHAEHARLFYVACTRARDRLVLIDGTTKPDGSRRNAAAVVWGHAVWDAVGPEALRAADETGRPCEVEIAPGVTILVDPGARWVRAEPAGWSDSPPAGDVARAGEHERAIAEAAISRVTAGADVLECAPTEIAEFRTCPRRYWYQTVLGVREPGVGGRRARVLGSLVHGALERWASGAVTDPEAALGPSLAFRVAEPALRAEVTGDVSRAIAWLETERAGGVRTVASELPFALALADDVVVRGRIDVVLERGATTVVRDYKYAARPETIGPAYRDQLAIYGVAMAAAGKAGLEAELLFLRGTPRVVPVDPGPAPEAAARALATARALRAALAAGDPDAFPREPTDPDACRELGCGFVRRCWVSESARGARDRTIGA